MASYTIAGVCMEIEPQEEFTKRILRAYQTPDAQPVLRITPCPDETEDIGLLRRIALELLQHHEAMYIHGAAIVYKGKGYLFTAPSGTGKSTHIRLWKQLLGDEAVILNGDKPFLRFNGGAAMVCGSPWRGKEGWGENRIAPLGGLFILRRGETDRVEKLPDLEILNELLAATVYPEDPETTGKLLELVGRLMETVPIRALYCTPRVSAVQTVLRHIEGDEA